MLNVVKNSMKNLALIYIGAGLSPFFFVAGIFFFYDYIPVDDEFYRNACAGGIGMFLMILIFAGILQIFEKKGV